MKAVWIIAKKELRTYFTSPIAYVIMTVFLVLVGFFFYSLIWWFNSQAMQAAQNPYYAQQMNINQMVFGPLFNNMSIILLLMLPLALAFSWWMGKRMVHPITWLRERVLEKARSANSGYGGDEWHDQVTDWELDQFLFLA